MAFAFIIAYSGIALYALAILVAERESAMLRFLIQDAIFGLVVLIEAVAALAIARDRFGVALRPEFDPVLDMYRGAISGAIGSITGLFSSTIPQWYNDAYVISVVLFFLFFIAQARNASHPHDLHDASGLVSSDRERIEVTVDAIVPAIICGLGAIIVSWTLLPILTIPIALGLGARRIAGNPSWFTITRTYYANLALVGGLCAVAIGLPG